MRTPFRILAIVLLTLFAACGGCDDGTGTEIEFEEDVGVQMDVDVEVQMDLGPDTSRFCEGARCDCEIGPLGGFCRTKYCGIVVEPQTLSELTEFQVTEDGGPEEIRDELLGGRICDVAVDADVQFERPFQASVYYEADEIPAHFLAEDVVGVHIFPEYTLAQQTALEPDRNRVLFSEEGPITYGATVLPAEPFLAGELGLEAFPLDTPEAYLRNLSRYEFSASFHDGQRFYVANGPRVLIWNDGVPTEPTTPPDVVLGTPQLNVRLDYASSSNFGGSARGIWSDGTRLAVSEGNRVLFWNQIPTESFASADLVLGQDEFSSNAQNRGGTAAADTLASPQQIWSDGERFIVADRLNYRFLVWNEYPVVSGQPADLVIGQTTFDERIPGGGALNAYGAWSSYYDGTRLALASSFACECITVLNGFPTASNPAADYKVGLPYALSRVDPTTFSNLNAISGFGADGLAARNGHRVSLWNAFPTDSVPADITLGKPNDSVGSVLGRISAASFSSSSTFGHVWSGQDYLFVGDGRRLLVWDGLPTSTFEGADLVIGQPGFATEDEAIDYRAIGADTLAYPTSVSSSGDVTVLADRANNRVLVLRGEPTEPDSVVVLGQPDATSWSPDGWGGEPSATTLDTPGNVFTDGARLFVSDSGNHRVLIWNDIPTTDQTPADIVLGQSDMTGEEPNGGAGPSANGLRFPAGLHYDGRLFVADAFNHRVLVWNELPSQNGAPADAVVGQPDFVSGEPNRGLGWYARNAGSLSRPMDVAVTGAGELLVADAENNRVMVFDDAGGDGFIATAVLGQPDYTGDISPNYLTGSNIGWPRQEAALAVSAASLRRPAGVAWSNGRLVVADTGNNRVVEFAEVNTGAAADSVRGQPDFDVRAANESSVGRDAVRAPEGVAFDDTGLLLVADTRNHRLLTFDAGRSATGVFGQAGMQRNGINGSSSAAGTLEGPGGLSLAADTLWVADRRNHRVVAYQNDAQTLVLGQEDPSGDFKNAGFDAPTAWTFANPTDVWSDGTRLVVADRDNHRVLIWNELPDDGSSPADVVVGQEGATAGSPNGGAGSGAFASTLLAPQGVLVHEDVLYVADTGNNRVLVYDPIPTASGAEATRVLCQDDFVANRANRGAGPTASTCSSPTDILAVGEALFVADTGNHRILRFGADTAADLVLGQPDFETREALDEGNQPSAARLSSPVRFAYDGTNFYVVDRGNHRVLVWDALPTTNFAPADRLLGQVDFDTGIVTPDVEGLEAPFGIAVETLPYHSARVWIADAGKDRLVSFEHLYRLF